jgi:hypothetical protein
MRSSVIALRGQDQVISAYTTNDMSAWAICNGKDIMFADEAATIEDGQALLTEVLQTLRKGGSRGVFTLRVYELEGKEKIKSNTPFSRSIPFLLWDDENEDPYRQGRNAYSREADEKIANLQKEIDLLKEQLEESDDRQEQRTGIDGFIAGIVEDPIMKQTLVRALAGIVSRIVPMPQQAASVAGIEQVQPQQVLQSVLLPGQPEKVQQAINMLCAKDQELGDHLLKLGNLAFNNQEQFQWMIGMLKNF